MKTMKKLFHLIAIFLAFGMIVSCNLEPENISDNSGSQGNSGSDSSTSAVIARYFDQEDGALLLEFYNDNTWILFQVEEDITNSNSCHIYILEPVYKGTYSGNPNANGQVSMTITNEEALPPSAEEQARVDALIEESLNSDRDVIIKANVPWTDYSGGYPDGTLTINNGTFQFADTTFGIENNNSGNSGNGSGNSGSGSSNPTIISKYTGDENFGKHTIEFYSDNTWVLYDRTDTVDTTKSCHIYIVAPFCKGTYSGNPNTDGQVAITITHEAVGISQEEETRLENLKQANMNSDRDVTIMANVQWEVYSESDATTTLTINNGTTEFARETFRR